MWDYEIKFVLIGRLGYYLRSRDTIRWVNMEEQAGRRRARVSGHGGAGAALGILTP